MPTSMFLERALFEHRFWLQILGDHARFIFHALSPKEKEEVKRAEKFIDIFDRLLHQVRRDLENSELQNATIQAQHYANQLHQFKLNLLRKHLTGGISISLAETFINHMVNELEEYLRILSYLTKGKVPPKSHEIHHHLVWLIDAAGHAGILTSSFDLTEKQLKQKSKMFEKRFEHFYLKAVEIAGYLRTNLTHFPALERFNSDVELEMKIFKEFLDEIEELGVDDALLGTVTPLMADHMAREECYYLMKLTESTGTMPLSCDPTKPRITS